jgi:4-hydroxybenzoyl-CoA thioesterase
VGFPTVKLEVEFASPVRFGDPLEVAVAIEHVGRTSLRVGYEGRAAGRVCFRAKNVVVCVDMKTFQPVPIPDDLRAAFESARG